MDKAATAACELDLGTMISASAASELTIYIWPRGYDEWIGSRAQLEAEGFTPPDNEWPERDQSLHWSAGGFNYWLGRTRPPGLKGPKKLWVEGDYWFLRRELTANAGTGYAAATIYEKRKELEDVLFRQSRDWNAQWERYWKAHEDKRFQAFKASIPGLVPPKRGRRPKSADQSQGASA